MEQKKRKGRRKMMDDFYKEIDRQKKLLPDIKQIEVRYCEESKTYKLNNKWHPFEDVAEVYKETARKAIEKHADPEAKITIKPIWHHTKVKSITFIATTNELEEEKTVPVHTDKTMNPQYAKKYAKALEGTLQLRNLDEDMFVMLKEELEASEKKFCHVTDLRERGQSIDIDMTCQREIERIARALQNVFGGELKIDYKLHTKDKQTQKDIYRITATVIFPKVKKGQYIFYKNAPCHITALDKDIHARNLKTGTLERIAFDEKIEKIEKHTTTVSKVEPRIEAIDPVTFQSEEVVFQDNQKKNLKINQKITVVKCRTKLYKI
ncbi:MAG: NMD3-related protein [Nanoarchaeota archaeon]